MTEYLIDAERFQHFVSKTGACWAWTGATDAYGYGRFHAKHFHAKRQAAVDRSLLAHRVAFLLAYGFSPPCVCHHCDNPPCVRPDHLFAGRRLDNNRDMVLKGRHAAQNGTQHHAAGTRYPHAKLTEADIPIIRSMWAAGQLSQRQIAAQYGVSQRTITKVVNRIGWVHV